MENGSDECKQEMSVKSVGSSKKSVPGILYLDTTNSKVNGEDETSSKNSYKSTKSDSVSRSNTKVLVNNKTAINSNNNNNSNNNSKSYSNNNIIIKKNLNNANHDLDFLEDAGEAKVKLQKLSEIFKFSVSYSDFQKRGKNSSSSSSEYLTLVSLSMKPAQVSHGSGATPQESQEDAAKSALKFLSENGIEVSSSPSSNENGCTNINNNCS